MRQTKQKPLTIGEVFAKRLRDVREQKQLTQEQLSELLAGLGVSIHRATVAKIENGGTRAENISVRDLLAFAAALNVAPVHLIVPFEDEVLVDGERKSVRLAITPRVSAFTSQARGWIRGNNKLRREDDEQSFYTHIPRVEFEHLLEQARQAPDGPRPLASHYAELKAAEDQDG